MLTTKLTMLVTKKMNILYMDLHLHSEIDHMLTECSLHFHLIELRQHGRFMNTVKITHKCKKASYDGYDLPKLTSLRAAV